MYELKLVFDPQPISLLAQESITYAATIDLFLRGIHTSQSSVDCILCESDRDRMLAVLILCDNPAYTPVCID